MGFEISKMDSIPAGENPFWHDHFNMGEMIGTNITIMFPCHQTEYCSYLIIVNTDTGERIRVNITKEDMLCLTSK